MNIAVDKYSVLYVKIDFMPLYFSNFIFSSVIFLIIES